MTILEILMGIGLIFLFLIFVVFLYCAMILNSMVSEEDEK